MTLPIEDEVGGPPRERRDRSVEVAGDHDRRHRGVHHAQVLAPAHPQCSATWPRTSVDAAELARHAIVAPRRGSAITTALGRLFADAGMPLRLALESGDPFLLRSLAARGFATAILPRSFGSLEGAALEIRSLQPAVRLPVALVWRRERNLPPAARTFIDFVRREAAAAP